MDANKSKTLIEISEIIFADRWDLKKRKEMYQSVYSKEYNGGDL